jgi:quercetin dioxygenase-like cupin family protein
VVADRALKAQAPFALVGAVPGLNGANDEASCAVMLTGEAKHWKERSMSLERTTGGSGLGPGEAEALWFNGGLGVLRATGDQTEGRYAVMELLAPKGFASPLHIHRREDEFFVVLSGEVRVQHGEDVIEAVAGSVVYGPRNVAHAFHVDSAEARLLLFFGPAGVEGFFREGGKPARSLGLPPADEEFLDKQALKDIASRYDQEFVGPPMPPKD